jgi:glycerol uptake facilitator protein
MELFIAEFFGTMTLLIFGTGVVAGVVLKGTKSNNAGWIVITFGWGLGVAIAVYAVGYISGAHLNPAVTVAELVAGNLSLTDALGYIVAQLLGAGVGATLVFYMYYPHYKMEENAGNKLATFSTGPAVRHTPSNFLSEAIGTFILLFGIQGINATGSGVTGGLGPLLVGLLVVGIGLTLGGTTGYAINPARDLGPRIAHFLLPVPGKGSSDWNYSWIPVVGPIIGGTLGLLSYQVLFNTSSDLVLELIIALGVFVVLQAATFFIKLDGQA